MCFIHFPEFRGTGGRFTYIVGNWREVRVNLPLSWRTRNYVGMIYGGSMYAAVDPCSMVMLIKIFGPEYIVWDKAASIRFKKSGTNTFFATFVISDEDLNAIKTALASAPILERMYHVEIVDAEGVVHAMVDKTAHIRQMSKPAEAGPSNKEGKE